MYLLVVFIEVTIRRDQLIGGLLLATCEFTLKEVVERSKSTTSSPESDIDLGIPGDMGLGSQWRCARPYWPHGIRKT
jgi:hypothetical protein